MRNYDQLKQEHASRLHTGMLRWDEARRKEWLAKVQVEEGDKKEGVAYVSPSSASLMVPGPTGFTHLEGTCHRATWLRKMGTKPSDLPNPSQLRKMYMGISIEAQEHEYANNMPPEMGKPIAHNVRNTYEITPTCIMKMEMDSILQARDEYKYVLEIKSFYGYTSKRDIFGNKTIKGKPKISHLMQTLLYLCVMNEKEKQVEYAVLHYISRDDAQEGMFIIEVEELKKDDKVIDAYPMIDGVTYRDVSIRSIFDRYIILGDYMLEDMIPPRDADPKWSEEKIQAMWEAKMMSKTAFTDWQKGKLSPKDWQCVAKGTMIRTDEYGWIPIEESKPGMGVLTSDGSYKEVVKVHKNGEKRVVRVKPYILMDYLATKDHKVLFGEANNYYGFRSKIENSLKFGTIDEIMESEKRIYLAYRIDDTGISNSMHEDTLSRDKIAVIASFITEGCYHKNEDGKAYKTLFTYSVDEKEHAEHIGKITLKLGATSYSISSIVDTRYGKPYRYLQLRVYGIAFVQWIKEFVDGERSYTKTLSDTLTMGSSHIQKELLDEMLFGDGCHLMTRGSPTEVYSTTSKVLALQVQEIYLRLGKIASIRIQKEGKTQFGDVVYDKREIYHVTYFPEAKQHYGWISNGMLYVPLNCIEDQSHTEQTFDLTIAERSEYLTQGGIVHNCGYCPYCTLCLGPSHGSRLPHPTDEEIIAKARESLDT